MIKRYISVFVVSVIYTFEAIRGNHCRNDDLSEIRHVSGIKWAPGKHHNFPTEASAYGAERSADGKIVTATYVARGKIDGWLGNYPGYLSSYKGEVVITGITGAPFYLKEYEILLSKPKWKLVSSGAEHIPLRAIPTGSYGSHHEPVYSCRFEADGLYRIGVMWWGQNYCHVLVDGRESGSREYEILVAE